MNRKTCPHGTYKDYPQIDIYIIVDKSWHYLVSTTWARSCKEAVQRYIVRSGNPATAQIRARYAKGTKK